MSKKRKCDLSVNIIINLIIDLEIFSCYYNQRNIKQIKAEDNKLQKFKVVVLRIKGLISIKTEVNFY